MLSSRGGLAQVPAPVLLPLLPLLLLLVPRRPLPPAPPSLRWRMGCRGSDRSPCPCAAVAISVVLVPRDHYFTQKIKFCLHWGFSY